MCLRSLIIAFFHFYRGAGEITLCTLVACVLDMLGFNVLLRDGSDTTIDEMYAKLLKLHWISN